MKSLIKSLLRPFPGLEARARRLRHRFENRSSYRRCRKSYAQLGEDLIIQFLMGWLKIPKPTYLDVGAHHPSFLSNTYLLYRNGSRGVCVEPDPDLCRAIARRRPRDKCLNVGVADGGAAAADFYVMSNRSLNTLSADEARRLTETGFAIDRVIRIPLVSINQIVREHFDPWPNLVTLDIEGLDLPVLRTFDFQRLRPEVFCVETLTHGTQRKITEIINFMRNQGYMPAAETLINTVFLEESSWKRLYGDDDIEPAEVPIDAPRGAGALARLPAQTAMIGGV